MLEFSTMLSTMSPYLLMYNENTHTHLTALYPGLPGWAGTRKVKPIWILLKQERVSGSGIIWAICKSAPRSRQITMPAPHHSVFLQAGCPSCHPNNSITALKTHTVPFNGPLSRTTRVSQHQKGKTNLDFTDALPVAQPTVSNH